ncbi:SNF2 family N-terminal domain-containing protein [Pseudomassariella vexata]|uniref:SNF2 family N-terminal domain-domain-containing protein n=1 Tax=Pseudomassariella vexata TaxID=1141098 RepID=A0A1Y2EAZ8_9PEZI|nr:SNF2 family N-terminal domain-containing protein [Pseudomassariella vexata]ORY68436.1 SNF2 family N-terminal domain-domain-containing protein [Pseudomassariella vexata]
MNIVQMSLKRILNDEGPSYGSQRLHTQNGYITTGAGQEDYADVFSDDILFNLNYNSKFPDFERPYGLGQDEFDDVQQWGYASIFDQQPDRASDSPPVTAEASDLYQGVADGEVMSNGVKPKTVCYGMLYNVDVKIVGDMGFLDTKLKPTEGRGPKQTQHFRLSEKPEHVLLSFDDGTEFGLLRSSMTKHLSDMLRISELDFEAVAETKVLRDTIGRAQKPSEALIRVSINIYGPPNQANYVGDLLSSHKLWLQKPEYARRDLPYENPQVLVFEGLDASILDTPVEMLQRVKVQAKPRTEEEHLHQTISDVYNRSKRQEGLQQIRVSRRFKKGMLGHQKEALDFMLQRESGEIPDQFRLWKEKVVEGHTSYQHSITKSKARTRPEEKGGGILADEMGMGKSLSILSLIVETLEKGQIWASKRRTARDGATKVKGHTRATLVVVSSALLINNWEKEIEEHLEDSLNVIRYHGPNRNKNGAGAAKLEDADIVVTTYNTLAKEFSDSSAFKKSSLLHDIEWYRVVLDEAHIIRRQATSFHKTCAELKAHSRWCLTGTPIQNKLEDIGSLFCFIRARPFDSMAVFRRYIAVPFEQNDDETTKERLLPLIESLCLRRTKDLLQLPDLDESVRILDLTEPEMKQYNKTQDILFRKIKQKVGEHEETSNFGLFQAQLQLRIMCNHGTFQQQFSWQSAKSLRDIKEAALSLKRDSAEVTCNGCSQIMPVLGSNELYNNFVEKCNHVLCSECLQDIVDQAGQVDARGHCPMCVRIVTDAPGVDMTGANASQSGRRGGELEDDRYFRHDGYSTKMQALISDVRQDLTRTKSIIFSCWTRTLNLVARHLKQDGIRFSRIDGECPLAKRQKILDDFAKRTGDPVLIMTTGTGAFGYVAVPTKISLSPEVDSSRLNLTCANRVFIVELQWNPSVESQAIARAIRLGQKQRVSVIRYIVNNTVEKAMQSQQEVKLRMAQKGFVDDADDAGAVEI